jgi:hypothetical protein
MRKACVLNCRKFWTEESICIIFCEWEDNVKMGLRECILKLWIGFIWQRAGTGQGCCEHGYEHWGFIQRRWIHWPDNNTVSYEISGSHGDEYDYIVFWDVAPCSHVEVNRRFRDTYCLHHHSDNDRGSTHFWNVGPFQRDYMALHPRRL